MGMMSKYRNVVLLCCAHCMTVEVQQVTDEILQEPHWSKLWECDECDNENLVCRVTKYQKPPGFARKCKYCYFRFACGTMKIKEASATLRGLMTFTFEVEDGEWLSEDTLS